MATLTASGVTTSNGQLDGFYTGSSNVNTSFPIGSYLGVADGIQTTASGWMNLTTSVYVPVNNNTFVTGQWYKITSFNGASALSGTWKIRGWGGMNNCLYTNSGLVQRIA